MATAAVTAAQGTVGTMAEKTAGPLLTPLAAPTAASQPAKRDELTKEHQEKYDWLLAQVKGWTDIKSTKVESGPLTDNERMWLTRECLLRYLRATKWHQKDAEKRLHDTVLWRRDFGVEGLTADHISPENETGKQMLVGYDKEARPCHYLIPGRQNTQPSHRQVEHLVYMVERVIEIMPSGQEMLALLIDFKASKSRSNTAPGIGIAREVLHILQTHYPERLGRALILNVPWVVWGFFKLITPFIDPHTKNKLKFNEDMTQYVPTEQLWTGFGGTLEFEYDHSVYWPALAKMCEEKREAKFKRWVEGGKQIGELEDYLLGGLNQGVAGPAQASDSAANVDEKVADVKPEDLKVDELKIGEEQPKESTA